MQYFKDIAEKWKEIKNHGFIFSLRKEKSSGLLPGIAKDAARLLSFLWLAQETVAKITTKPGLR